MYEHLEKQGVDTQAIKERIDDLVVKTLLAVETQVRRTVYRPVYFTG